MSRQTVPNGWTGSSAVRIRQFDWFDSKLVYVDGSEAVSRWWAVWRWMSTQFRQVVWSCAMNTAIYGYSNPEHMMRSVISCQWRSCPSSFHWRCVFVIPCVKLSWLSVSISAHSKHSASYETLFDRSQTIGSTPNRSTGQIAAELNTILTSMKLMSTFWQIGRHLHYSIVFLLFLWMR